jgi:mannosyltransferase
MLLFALTLAVGAYRLDAKSMWHDELFSVAAARLDLPGLIQVASTGEAQMSLYYQLLHWWIALAGDSEAGVRALSLLAGAGAVLLAYALGRKLVGSPHAFLGAGFLAVHAFFVLHAQEARAYTLLLLLTTASSLLFLRAVERPSAGRWAAYAIVSALGLYAHLFAAWTIAAHGCVLLLGLGRPMPRVRGGVALAAIVALSLPLLWWMLETPSDAFSWIVRPNRNTLQTLVHDFSGFGGLPVALLLTGLGGAFVLWGQPATPRNAPVLRWTKAFLLLWASVVVFGPVVASFLVRPMFVPRYVISALVPLLLLAAGGILLIRPGWLRAAVLLVVLAALGRGVHRWYGASPLENWRGSIALLLERAKPGDGVVFHRSYGRFAFDFYSARHSGGTRGLEPVFPAEPWNTVTLRNGRQIDAETWLQTHEVLQPRVWTLERWYESDSTGEQLWLPSTFRRHYCEAERHHLLRVRVILHRRCELSE